MPKNVRNLPLLAWNSKASCPTNCHRADKTEANLTLSKAKTLMAALILPHGHPYCTKWQHTTDLLFTKNAVIVHQEKYAYVSCSYLRISVGFMRNHWPQIKVFYKSHSITKFWMQVYKYNVSLALKQIFEKHLFIQTNYSPYLIKLIKIKIKMMCSSNAHALFTCLNIWTCFVHFVNML